MKLNNKQTHQVKMINMQVDNISAKKNQALEDLEKYGHVQILLCKNKILIKMNKYIPMQ